MRREKLRLARRKRGLSQQNIAELLGVAQKTYSQWETGATEPYPHNINELTEFFGVSDPALLDLVDQDPQRPLPIPTEFDDITAIEEIQEIMEQFKVSRRRALTILLGTAGSMLIAPSVEALPKMAGEILPFTEKNLAECWDLSKGKANDMIIARQSVASYIPALTALVEQSSAHREQAAHLAAQCYRLRSLLAYHMESLAIAQDTAKQALAFSEIAGDTDLHVILLTHAALVDYYAKQPQAALDHCQQAKSYRQRASHAVQSKLYRIQAACEAQIDGLEVKARQSLNLADKHYSLHMAANASSSVLEDDAKTFELQLWQGITLHHLGDGEAINILESAKPFNAALPERVRTGIIDNLLFAELQGPVKNRDLERLATRWTEANRRANALQSRLRQDEVRSAYDGLLVAFPGEQRIRSLRTINV
jgi:transcriptional regulator with XRE-family HTH domain